MTGIADELVLLGYGDDGEAVVGQPALDYSLSGAVLVEPGIGGREERDRRSARRDHRRQYGREHRRRRDQRQLA